MPMAEYCLMLLIYSGIFLVGKCYCCKRNSHFFRCCSEWHKANVSRKFGNIVQWL